MTGRRRFAVTGVALAGLAWWIYGEVVRRRIEKDAALASYVYGAEEGGRTFARALRSTPLWLGLRWS